jgi:hypothetical protein
MCKTEKNSGRLWVEAGTIHYDFFPDVSWTIPLDELLIFGEYTNAAGPFLDDYYFVFVTGLEKVYAASFYSEGRDEFLKVLGRKLKVTFECKLVGSTDCASNVLWPTDIVGQPLYEFVEKPTKGIGTKVLRWFGFGRMDATYSPQVLAKLGQQNIDGCASE